MQNITTIAELRVAIQFLEIEQMEKRIQLKEQFYITYESLKPINLIKSTLKELFTSPNLIDNIIGTSLGIASGYLSKKIVIGASHNIFRKLLGSLLEFGVSNLVAQHPDGVKSIGQHLFQLFFHKKERISSQEE